MSGVDKKMNTGSLFFFDQAFQSDGADGRGPRQ